ncbi:MAG: hypothetical protein H0T76_05375 [Nannocystis sp.]|nr:hypothetical protein [Nannocystis sp.]MBA3545895.1 hypothetical protein [Nannocystis sp.]
MLVYVYLFSFALGGLLLLASILLGDKDSGHADGEADADAELGHVSSGGATQGLDHGVVDSHGSLSGVFTAFLSMRFWMFFLAFFGLTGLVLDGLDLVPNSSLALVLALAMGLVTGQVTVAVFRHLGASETSTAAGAHDYVGKSGRVLVGFGPGELGKLRLTLKGTTVDVLATSDEEQRFAIGDSALVIQMNETTAVVAREPGSGSGSHVA